MIQSCINAKAKAPGFKVESIENTGAGDTFFGCALSFISDLDLSLPDDRKLTEILQFANAGAAIIATKKGALKVMPDIDEIMELLKIDQISVSYPDNFSR